MPNKNDSISSVKSVGNSIIADSKTLGFVIENIANYLPSFGERPLFLGWMFHFTSQSTPRDPFDNISEITVSEVVLEEQGDGSYQITSSPLTDMTINPMVNFQVQVPEYIESSDNYLNYLNKTLSGYKSAENTVDSIEPLIKKLEGYMPWADAAYIRATDLRLLKTYLLNDPSGYNDVFFSGAKVNFSTMNNARLRMEQRYLKLDSGILNTDKDGYKDSTIDLEGIIKNIGQDSYLDSSVAFTLKAEPVLNRLPPVPPDSGDQDKGDEEAPGSGSGSGSGNLSLMSSGGAGGDGTESKPMMPAVFPLVGCPKYWAVFQAIRDQAAIALSNPSISLLPMNDAGIEDLEELMSSFSDTTITDDDPSTWLAQMLRRLANLIDEFFAP